MSGTYASGSAALSLAATVELHVLDRALLEVEQARPPAARAAGVRDGLVDRAAL